MPLHPTSWRIHLNIILPLHLGLPRRSILILFFHYTWVFQVVSFPQVSPPKPSVYLSSPPTCPDHLVLLDMFTQIIFGEECRSVTSSLFSFLYSPVTSSLLDPNVLLSTLFSNTLAYFPPSMWAPMFHTHTKTAGKITFQYTLIFIFLDRKL